MANCRVDFFEHRDDIQTHLVSYDVIYQIGTVCYEVLMAFRQIVEDVLSGDTKEWTDDVSVDRRNACKSFQSCTSYQIDKNCLNIVVLMMGYSYTCSVHILAKLIEIAVA